LRNKNHLGTLTQLCFRGKGDRDANTVNVIFILVASFHLIVSVRNQGFFWHQKWKLSNLVSIFKVESFHYLTQGENNER
jgi:hypothetical protein